MPSFDASSAEIVVLTFKEGLLSPMAHDLKLRATSFTIRVDDDGDHVTAEIDAGSLRVVTPMKHGQESAGALPTVMYAEIEKNTRNDVLETTRHRSITFDGSLKSLSGKLTLHGVTRDVTAKTRAGGWYDFALDQRQFGIKPYSAFLNTLKVKPDLIVQVRLPATPA